MFKSLSKTRWAACLKAEKALIQNFECIADCLENKISRVGASGDDVMVAQTLLSSNNWLFFLICYGGVQCFIYQLIIFFDISILGNYNSTKKKEIDLIMAQNYISTA
jgi:hypothetical protein